MSPRDFTPRFVVSLLMTGVLAGMVGIVLTVLLHGVQHLAFSGVWSGSMPFNQLAGLASPWRRVWVLTACGALAGVGWYLIHRFGSPLVDVKTVVTEPDRRMPLKTTIGHALLQIVTVGMGSPLGREGAPREMSVALATPLLNRMGLEDGQKRVLFACAAGAGLASVYNVPFAATVFVLETLLLGWQLPMFAAAVLTCGTAVLTARWGLGDLVQYNLPLLAYTKVNEVLLVWSVAAGVVMAAGVRAFVWSLDRLPKWSHRHPALIVFSAAAFGLIGVMSVWYPEILGNGKSGNQLSFANLLTWEHAAGLLAAKWLAIMLAMVAGAYGGRITPSMMLGGLIALLLALSWNIWLPAVPVGAAAFVGATVFLGMALNMRLTAIVFTFELSRLPTGLWLPVCLCMGTALAVHIVWDNARKKS